MQPMSRSVAPPSPQAAAGDAQRPADVAGADAAGAGPRPGVALAAGALAFAGLAGAGLLMWAAQGDAVFAQVVLAALAWCF